LLGPQHLGLLAVPEFQSRLLDGSGKRKRHCPWPATNAPGSVYQLVGIH
jgi:hypothetical protein